MRNILPSRQYYWCAGYGPQLSRPAELNQRRSKYLDSFMIQSLYLWCGRRLFKLNSGSFLLVLKKHDMLAVWKISEPKSTPIPIPVPGAMMRPDTAGAEQDACGLHLISWTCKEREWLNESASRPRRLVESREPRW